MMSNFIVNDVDLGVEEYLWKLFRVIKLLIKRRNSSQSQATNQEADKIYFVFMITRRIVFIRITMGFCCASFLRWRIWELARKGCFRV